MISIFQLNVKDNKLGGDPCDGTYKYLQEQHECVGPGGKKCAFYSLNETNQTVK